MSILSEIGAFFLGIPKETLTFLMGTAKALASNPQIQAIATQEVAAAESAAIAAAVSGSITTGAAKFASAQAGVIAQLTKAGLPVVMNQVNLAIEGAVANLPKVISTPVAAVVAATEAPIEAAVTTKAEAAASTIDPAG